MISEELEISIQNAFEMAKLKKHEFLTLEHLMLELCKDVEIKALFNFTSTPIDCSYRYCGNKNINPTVTII